MAPRFDSDQLTLELAVADLLDTQLLRSLGFANRGGYERMWLGQAIHSRYQDKTLREDPTYRSEVGVTHTFEHRDWKVTIKGRADGLRRDAEGTLVVEEIKSVRRGAQLAPMVRQLYDRQASLYAWMLQQQGEEKIRAELILIEIGGEQVVREQVDLNLRATTGVIFRRINTLLKAHKDQKAARGARRQAADALEFPYPERRGGQDDIITAVEQALEQGEHLLIEAPTGIGKTVAALYPTLKNALTNDRRVFVLTAKNLQQNMAVEVLDLLNELESFRSLRLRAKARMCANDQVLCHEEYCNFARDYYLKLQRSEITSKLLESYPTLLPDDIFSVARRTEVCPFEISLELTSRVQAVVCDYNYAFDPYVALTDFSQDADLSNTVLIIDEVHNLVDRGRGYYSPMLSSEAARRTAEAMAMGGAPIYGELAHLCFEIENLLFETVSDAQPPGDPKQWALEYSLPEDEIWRLRPQLDTAFVDYLEYRRETRTLTADDLFVDLYFNFLRFVNVMALKDNSFSHYLERQGEDHSFRILCKDPSRFLGEVINRCHSVLGLSATLSPHEFYRDLLGFDPARTSPLQVPNPFPVENRRVVIDTQVETTWRERPAYTPIIGQRLGRFADAVPGNCLALFPSYAFLSDVAVHLRTDHKRVLVQGRGDGEEQRNEILETLRTAIFGDVLLLAVAGGVFAEGVDYPGEMLKAVAVVGPCLPAVSLEQQLLRDYYEERFEKGFEYAFVVPGMTRVVQAAGRLIRSPDDQGVIALFDKRFLWRAYRQHLPVDWADGGNARKLVGEPDLVAEGFFRDLGKRV